MVLNQALSLLFISLAVAVLPSISRLVRLPQAVVEILFGVVLGKSLLHLQFSGEWLPFLAELGFLLLMFHAGMEIDFRMLRKQGRGRLLMHLVIFGVTLGLTMTFSRLLGFSMFMALLLTTTSPDVVMSVLKETKVSKTPYGQALLIAATLADFLILLSITFYILWSNHGLSLRFIYPLPLFVGFGILLWIGRWWAWWNPEKAERILGRYDTQEVGMRLSLAILFLLVAMSELAHLEPVLGAFMGGALLAFVFHEKEHLENKLSALGFGFLIPIFFIHVGMQFNLGNVLAPKQFAFTMIILVLAVGVKLIAGLMFTLIGHGPGAALKAGFLLSSRLSLLIAAAAIGLQEGFITSEVKDSVVFLALLTCLIGPTVFKAATPKKPEPGPQEKTQNNKQAPRTGTMNNSNQHDRPI